MAAHRRVYDSRHLQADCRAPGSAPDVCLSVVIRDYLISLLLPCNTLPGYRTQSYTLVLFRSSTYQIRPMIAMFQTSREGASLKLRPTAR